MSQSWDFFYLSSELYVMKTTPQAYFKVHSYLRQGLVPDMNVYTITLKGPCHLKLPFIMPKSISYWSLCHGSFLPEMTDTSKKINTICLKLLIRPKLLTRQIMISILAKYLLSVWNAAGSGHSKLVPNYPLI